MQWYVEVTTKAVGRGFQPGVRWQESRIPYLEGNVGWG